MPAPRKGEGTPPTPRGGRRRCRDPSRGSGPSPTERRRTGGRRRRGIAAGQPPPSCPCRRAAPASVLAGVMVAAVALMAGRRVLRRLPGVLAQRARDVVLLGEPP